MPSQRRTRVLRRVLMPSTLAVAALLAMCGPSTAQTRATGKGAEGKVAELRATGVLEWTGEAGKPSASRLIPVAVFTGDRYQDAGLYMARPEPMAVQGDTEYELQQAGLPKGRFDLFSAGNVEGFWFGYGVWKPLTTVKVAKLSPSKVAPEVVKDVDPDHPHLGQAKGDAQKPDATGGSAPEKPEKTGKDAPLARAGTEPHVSSRSDDPDRPKLRQRPRNESASDVPAEVGSKEDSDPDRPRLHRGIPESVKEAGKLTGAPLNLQQMVALSTTTSEEPHSYVYQWADPGDATKMQSALEKLAREALAGGPAPIAAAKERRATAHSTHSAKEPLLPAMGLMVEDFRAFELSYSGGATIVFSSRTAGGLTATGAATGAGDAIKYVTLIAQPDFYGAPRVIFKQVTDARHLDVTPRMKLIDAVDTNGDHRAELVFELRGRGGRQFGIYRVASGRAEQVFLSGELP